LHELCWCISHIPGSLQSARNLFLRLKLLVLKQTCNERSVDVRFEGCYLYDRSLPTARKFSREPNYTVSFAYLVTVVFKSLLAGTICSAFRETSTWLLPLRTPRSRQHITPSNALISYCLISSVSSLMLLFTEVPLGILPRLILFFLAFIFADVAVFLLESFSVLF